MEMKLMALLIGVIILGSFGSVVLLKSLEHSENIEMAGKDLEECPNLNSRRSTSETIWVKSCKEYTETYYKFNTKSN